MIKSTMENRLQACGATIVEQPEMQLAGFPGIPALTEATLLPSWHMVSIKVTKDPCLLLRLMPCNLRSALPFARRA